MQGSENTFTYFSQKKLWSGFINLVDSSISNYVVPISSSFYHIAYGCVVYERYQWLKWDDLSIDTWLPVTNCYGTFFRMWAVNSWKDETHPFQLHLRHIYMTNEHMHLACVPCSIADIYCSTVAFLHGKRRRNLERNKKRKVLIKAHLER